jgi:hypothetical protein
MQEDMFIVPPDFLQTMIAGARVSVQPPEVVVANTGGWGACFRTISLNVSECVVGIFKGFCNCCALCVTWGITRDVNQISRNIRDTVPWSPYNWLPGYHTLPNRNNGHV